MYEVLEHTADLGLRVVAPTREALFAEAARGLFSTIVANLDAVRPEQQRRFTLPTAADDHLLVDWLSELLYVFEAERLVLSEFTVRLGEKGLEAEAWGETLDPARHRLEHEVKAVTYHGLDLRATDAGWEAVVILDI